MLICFTLIFKIFYYILKNPLTTNCISDIIQLQPYYTHNTVCLLKGVEELISFDSFIIQNDLPIYLQILRHIKRGVVSGAVVNGDELPSRRMLSALLGVNPNTIQKAYRQLEDEGLIESHSGSKSYMVLDSARIDAVREELVEDDAKSAVEKLKDMGLSKADALALIEKYWN